MAIGGPASDGHASISNDSFDILKRWAFDRPGAYHARNNAGFSYTKSYETVDLGDWLFRPGPLPCSELRRTWGTVRDWLAAGAIWGLDWLDVVSG
jgi:hypothetical protein